MLAIFFAGLATETILMKFFGAVVGGDYAIPSALTR